MAKQLKLGLQLGYWGSQPPRDTIALVQEAERLGFDSVWTAEAYGSDALTPLAYVAAHTSKIRLGTGICQRLNDAGISRIDDLVSRSIESLRYWVGLTDTDVGNLQSQLVDLGVPLETLLPLWVRAHYSDLEEAFEEEVEQLLSRDRAVDALGYSIAAAQPLSFGTANNSAVQRALSLHSTPSCLEDELESFFVPEH